MNRCHGTTRAGSRCKKGAANGLGRYCKLHSHVVNEVISGKLFTNLGAIRRTIQITAIPPRVDMLLHSHIHTPIYDVTVEHEFVIFHSINDIINS